MMGLMLFRRLCTALLPVLLWTAHLSAGVAGVRESYGSETDLYEAFEEGRLTEREYLELVELYRYPVDLNGGDLERLAAVPGIDDAQIEYIRSYRDRSGRFAAPESLAAVAGVDDDLLLPFVRVRPAPLPVTGTVRCRLRQDAGRGAEPDVRSDAVLAFRNRFEFGTRAGDGTTGGTGRTFVLTYRGGRFLRRAQAGRFSKTFGHKLVFGGAHRDGGGTRLAGTGVELGRGPWRLELVQTSSDLVRFMRDDDGDSTVLRDLCGVVHAAYGRKNGFSAGFIGLAAEVLPYGGHGARYRIAGADWRYRYRHLSFIGEAAATHHGRAGALGGLVWKKRRFATRILYREYAPGFYNPYARSVSSEDGADAGAGERGLLVRSDMHLPGAVKVWGSFNTWTVPGTGTWHRDDLIGFRQRYGGRHRWDCGVAFAADDLAVPEYGTVSWWVRNDLRPDVLPGLTVKALYRTRRNGAGTVRDAYAWVKAEKTFWKGVGVSLRVKADDNDLDRYGDAWLLLECAERIRTVGYLEVETTTAYTLYESGRDAALRVTVEGAYRFE